MNWTGFKANTRLNFALLFYCFTLLFEHVYSFYLNIPYNTIQYNTIIIMIDCKNKQMKSSEIE